MINLLSGLYLIFDHLNSIDLAVGVKNEKSQVSRVWGENLNLKPLNEKRETRNRCSKFAVGLIGKSTDLKLYNLLL